jgi:hypothetical protein
VLAFCGLRPDQAPPAEPDDPVEAADLAAFAGGEAERLVAALRQALDPDPWAELATPDLLGAVARRSANIVADPGWIDVELHLDEVRTEVRRAGLDLDLGYRPWLGVVVRFRYG